jgi:tetratricopeptide (TPR) repeat protein
MACLETGAMFSQGSQFRQAAEEYKRVVDFYPNDLFPRVQLAEVVLSKGAARQGLEIINEIHRRGDEFGLNTNGFIQVLRVELAAHLMNTDPEGAERVVKAALEKHSGQQDLLSMASHVYLTLGYSSNALSMLDEQLKLRPDDRGALVNLGLAWIRLTNYAKAIPPLTRVVEMGTNSSPESLDVYYRALYNRAVAHEKNDQLELAQKDFEQIQKALPKQAMIAYNLAEVGDRKKDTNYAIQNYERFLNLLAEDNQPTNTPAVSNVLERLSQLKRSKR